MPLMADYWLRSVMCASNRYGLVHMRCICVALGVYHEYQLVAHAFNAVLSSQQQH